MKHYFNLQKIIFERHLRANGVRPWVAYVFGPLLFVGLCLLLLERSNYAAYAIALFGLSLVVRLSGPRRNDFIKIQFRPEEYRKIRLIENTLFVLPFALILLLQGFWALALVQCLFGGALVFLPINALNAKAFSTPFSKRPWEFATGFRKSWPLLLIAAFLLTMGLRVGNFELSVFSACIPGLVAMGYYGKPEPGFYVWVHTFTPRAFLHRKLMMGCTQLFLLGLPFLVAVFIYFPDRWTVIFSLQLLIQLYLILMITAKYANYPEEIDLQHSFLMGAAMVLPPLLFGVIPFFYRRALGRLILMLPPPGTRALRAHIEMSSSKSEQPDIKSLEN